jgi:DNA/RNA-binding domain of Phe-tRNA-synthetase-like protein
MLLPNISISSQFKAIFSQFQMGVLASAVIVEESNLLLQAEMNEATRRIETWSDIYLIRQMAAVKSAKQAYKKLGKDPNRYRPAAESLLRRVFHGKGLYRVNNVVDVINLVSLKSGYSICAYDLDKIDDDICLGIGETDEPYKGIGRGDVNITDLPVFRDSKGAFGTPTSDSVRTMIDDNTTRMLIMVPCFTANRGQLEEMMEMLISHLIEFAECKNPETEII